MKMLLIAFMASALMVGCGSSVKLGDVPVEDKSGTSLSQAGAEGLGSVVANNGVASVELNKSSNQGAAPAGPNVVYFDYDSYSIKPEFQAVIEQHARHIKMVKTQKVAIEGHTDERGGREYNLALGQKRAESVRNALGLLGVDDRQIEAVSFGKEKPAVQGLDEIAMSKNRRAEISYR
jgi:peptidoglycan-associated lipoprotein